VLVLTTLVPQWVLFSTLMPALPLTPPSHHFVGAVELLFVVWYPLAPTALRFAETFLSVAPMTIICVLHPVLIIFILFTFRSMAGPSGIVWITRLAVVLAPSIPLSMLCTPMESLSVLGKC
jgi:hypothetical protein